MGNRQEQVRELYNKGLRVAEIGRLLDMTRAGVYWHLHNMGLPTPKERDQKNNEKAS
jgi:hypothetical protein